MVKRNLVLLVLLVFSIQTMKAQLGFSHEIGPITGPVAFQSDYGVRHDFDTNKGNTGVMVGLVHYINFAYRADCNCYTKDTYFNDHFKLRNEISWNRTKLNHFGEWVKPERQSQNAQYLRQMEAVAKVLDIGSQIEFFPYSIRDFAAGGYSFAPFIAVGAHYNSYGPDNNFDPNNPLTEAVNLAAATEPDNEALNIWRPEALSNERGSTWSLIWSVGTRYKLTPLSDLMLELRWQYYFSDWVDGLNHNGPADKNYDWNVLLNFGYIYYLD